MSRNIFLRRTGLGGAALLVALAVSSAPWAVPGAAQAGAEIVLADPTGDVSAVTSEAPVPLPVVADGLDITEAKLYDESGEAILLKVTVKDMDAEETVPTVVSGSIIVNACFTWNNKLMAARIPFRPAGAGQLGNTELGVVDGSCKLPSATISEDIVQFSQAENIGFDVFLDKGTNSITASLKRTTLGRVAGQAPPHAGDTLGGFWVIVADGQQHRWDAAPNAEASPDAMPLASDTANLMDLNAVAESNVPLRACAGRIDAPAYAIEAGGTRGVPIVFENRGTATRAVHFTATTVSGSDWKPRIVPQLDVPPSSTSGNTTVTAILTTEASTQHTDCAIVRIRGVDANDALTVGEASVIVVAVQPPSPALNRLWLHNNEHAGPGFCAANNMWLNVLEVDPADAADPAKVPMKDCRNPDMLHVNNINLATYLDINPNYDLIVNTSAEGVDKFATAHAIYYSENAPTKATIRATIVTRTDPPIVIGEGSLEQEIGTSNTVFEFPVRIGFTREAVATGDPSRVLFSNDGLGVIWSYEPSVLDPNVEQPVAGTINLVIDGTFIDLPIWDTIKRNANEPGQAGGLISIKPRGELPRFAAPGLPRLLNFTVLNEGAEPDAAMVSATFTGAANWKAQFFPPGAVPLQPGQRAEFQVAVTPPGDAKESESVVFDLRVTSQRDSTASSSVAVRILASRQANIGGDPLPDVQDAKGGGGLPGPSALALLGLVAVAAFGLRRRQR